MDSIYSANQSNGANVYRSFVRALIINYLFGSVIAVIGVGGSLIFSTLSVSHSDDSLLAITLGISLMIMVCTESVVFARHVSPIRSVFLSKDTSQAMYIKAYRQTYRFPVLSVCRIMGPHWLGALVPGVTISLIEIHYHILSLPYTYVFLAILGSFLVAGMHAMVEFFLTSKAIQPALAFLRNVLDSQSSKDTSFINQVLVSVRVKFLLSVLVIGVLPLVLFGMAAQIRLSETGVGPSIQYWDWIASVMVIGIVFAALGAWLLSDDVKSPIATLEHLMLQVQKGHFGVRASAVYSDEFSKLASGFNHMVIGLAEREKTNDQLIESYFATLAAALDARDPYTAGHSTRVAHYAVMIGREIGLGEGEISLLRKSALLHDIGKIGIRDDVLLKDGNLTDEEFELIKQHPVIGESILQKIQPNFTMQPLLPGVRSHHERFDGKGYPDGLTGEQIPLFGRVLAVADAYDAMTSDRPYRAGMTQDRALSILQSGKGTQWDPQFVDAFMHSFGQTVDTVSTTVSVPKSPLSTSFNPPPQPLI